MLLNEMPNQDDFKFLILEPADICAQSSSWESSKRMKIHGIDKNTPKELMEASSEQPIRPGKIAATVTFDREERNRTGDLEPLDGEIEFITFAIGATRMHDPSKPMPPPSRFSRKGYSTQ